VADFLIPATVSAAVDHNGCMVLLNGATGQWHALNGTGTKIFAELQNGHTLAEAVVVLMAAHPLVPEALLTKDAQNVVAALVRRGLLVPDTTSTRRTAAIDMVLPLAPSGPIAAVDRLAVLVAFPVALLLLVLPFRWTIAIVGWLKRQWVRSPAGHDRAMAMLVAVHIVTRHHPGRLACLERSLTCVLALAIRRQAVDWCFGAATDPRSFHAWIEADGIPVVHPLDQPVSAYRLVLRA
jgi:hypothetical protein